MSDPELRRELERLRSLAGLPRMQPTSPGVVWLDRATEGQRGITTQRVETPQARRATSSAVDTTADLRVRLQELREQERQLLRSRSRMITNRLPPQLGRLRNQITEFEEDLQIQENIREMKGAVVRQQMRNRLGVAVPTAPSLQGWTHLGLAIHAETLMEIFEAAVAIVPIVGDILDAIEVVTGGSWLTQRRLSGVDQGMASASVAVGGLGILLRSPQLVGLARAGRASRLVLRIARLLRKNPADVATTLRRLVNMHNGPEVVEEALTRAIRREPLRPEHVDAIQELLHAFEPLRHQQGRRVAPRRARQATPTPDAQRRIQPLPARAADSVLKRSWRKLEELGFNMNHRYTVNRLEEIFGANRSANITDVVRRAAHGELVTAIRYGKKPSVSRMEFLEPGRRKGDRTPDIRLYYENGQTEFVEVRTITQAPRADEGPRPRIQRDRTLGRITQRGRRPPRQPINIRRFARYLQEKIEHGQISGRNPGAIVFHSPFQHMHPNNILRDLIQDIANRGLIPDGVRRIEFSFGSSRDVLQAYP